MLPHEHPSGTGRYRGGLLVMTTLLVLAMKVAGAMIVGRLAGLAIIRR